MLTYDSGSVQVFGTFVDSERAAERVKERIGFLPQGLGLNLYPDLSVEENIDFFARLRLVPDQDLAERKPRLLAMTRLDTFRNRAMKHLSGGMKQKLGLISRSSTTGIAILTSRQQGWILYRAVHLVILAELIHTKGMTALVSTADMDEAARFHHLSFLSHGKVLAAGTPAQVRLLVSGRSSRSKRLLNWKPSLGSGPGTSRFRR